MQLSSLNRLRIYIGGPDNRLSNDSGKLNNAELMMLMTSASSRIEQYLNRTIQYQTVTLEYHDVTYGRTIFFPKVTPVASITSLKYASDAKFDGSNETTMDSDEYFIGSDSTTINLTQPLSFVRDRGMQMNYVGGLAAHAVNSTFAYGTLTGSIAAASYVKGATSGAVGIVNTAPAANSVVIETLYGVFLNGEQVDKTASEGAAADGSNYFDISALTSQALCETYPDIVTACEMEVRFAWKHKMDYENMGTQKDLTNRQSMPGSNNAMYRLRPETMAMLAPYKRYALGNK